MRFDVTTTTGGAVALIVPSSGIVTLKVRKQLQQESFKLFVGAVQFVNQQYWRRAILRMLNGLQQRSLEQESLREQFALHRLSRQAFSLH